MDNCEISERSLLEYVRKSSPPPFLLKTYMLVEDPASDEVISWNDDGTAFVVWQPAEFARDLLPTLFKHSNFSSFVRQLNTYGFRKIATSRWEFSNEMFRKGAKDQLCEIRRRKAWNNNNKSQTKKDQSKLAAAIAAELPLKEAEEDQRSSSTSSSSDEYSILVHENKRLKKENGFLSSELSTMKNKCKELLELVAAHSSSEKEGNNLEGKPKLFGVRLEVEAEIERKRKMAEIRQNATLFLFQSCK
uniref:HF type transcription factor n=1 Tax=Catharanthus roseus TaxID=4058 RepID=A0A8A6LXM1_CATRO|nr:HF type transcription factor [Catharanthus roseus]